MRKIYSSIDDVLRSPWGAIKHQDEKAAATDRVLRSTKLEDSIYADLRTMTLTWTRLNRQPRES